MSLFDMNGPLMYNLGKLANIFLCNVLFCLFSLPLFTIGAALSALFFCMQAIWDDDEDVRIPRRLLLHRLEYDRDGGEDIQSQLLYDVRTLSVRIPISVSAAGKIQEYGQEYHEECMASQYRRAAVDGAQYLADGGGGVSFLLHESRRRKPGGVLVGNSGVWHRGVPE